MSLFQLFYRVFFSCQLFLILLILSVSVSIFFYESFLSLFLFVSIFLLFFFLCFNIFFLSFPGMLRRAKRELRLVGALLRQELRLGKWDGFEGGMGKCV